MTKVFVFLILALILLGFLISTTFNIYEEMNRYKIENQKLMNENVQLRAFVESLRQEISILEIEKQELLKQLGVLEEAYLAEMRARLDAEKSTKILWETNIQLNEQLATGAYYPTQQLDNFDNQITPLLSGPITRISLLLGTLCFATIAGHRFLRVQKRRSFYCSRSQ